MSYFAHDTAVIDPGASIGEGTKIWHFSHLMPGAVLGAHCNLGQNVFVADDVRIGNGVKIQNNVSVYGGVTLEDDVFLGPSMVFTNVQAPRSFFEQKSYAKTHVAKGASIGANATIVCGHNIGAYAFIGAGAVVTADVPAFAMMVGVPARRIGWVSRHGLRLSVDDTGRAVCEKTGERYQYSEDSVTLITSAE
jgi:UDP-2-acetamido-3-amino-2,3-dideoxy-glucuronate N-acetyltransferase